MKKSFTRSLWITIVLVLALIAGAVLASLAAFSLVRDFILQAPGLGQVDSPQIDDGPTPTSLPPGFTPLPGEIQTAEPLGTPVPSENPWDGSSRVTILLLGLDYRDWSAGEKYSRSDTMILLTLDPLSNTAGILSIPRDLWVAIPGFKHGKINTAYYLGDAYKLPGGGPALAVKTVESVIGVPINYYAQIDFAAFVRFIDEIGGVKINVPEKITIDLIGAGSSTKKTLKPGVQVLPGEWALAYARARYTEGGDFDRAQRQQQVIFAIRDRILSSEMLPTLINRAPELYRELSSGVNTNLTLDEAIKLALLAKNVPAENIVNGAIGKEQVVFGFSPDKLSILIPLGDKIRVLRDKIFAANTGLGPETPGDEASRFNAEGARLAVLDGSGISGLAERTAEFLRTQGGNVIQVAQAGENYSLTTLVDHTGNPYSLQFLMTLLQVRPTKIISSYDPGSTVDLEIYLGSDWARNNSLP